LAADIGRYLRNEPVTAHPASAGYRAWKYVRRHRLGVAFAAAVAFLLVAGLVATSWMALRASRAEQEAKAVNDFLQNDVLAQASVDGQSRAHGKPDPDMKVRTALDRAAAKIEGKFGKQPLVDASVRETIGNSYFELGLYPQAQREFERALDLRRPILGVDHPGTLLTLRGLAVIYRDEGRLKAAERFNGEALQAQRRVLGAPASPARGLGPPPMHRLRASGPWIPGSAPRRQVGLQTAGAGEPECSRNTVPAAPPWRFRTAHWSDLSGMGAPRAAPQLTAARG
jgi:tetratricopeptide (TPR) repeat protein